MWVTSFKCYVERNSVSGGRDKVESRCVESIQRRASQTARVFVSGGRYVTRVTSQWLTWKLVRVASRYFERRTFHCLRVGSLSGAHEPCGYACVPGRGVELVFNGESLRVPIYAGQRPCLRKFNKSHRNFSRFAYECSSCYPSSSSSSSMQ